MRRVGLPPGGSILITSAPRPARVRPQYSACSSASSMTRMPVRGPRDTSPWAAMIDALQSSHHAMRGAYVDGSRQDYILFGRVGPIGAENVDAGRAGYFFSLMDTPAPASASLTPCVVATSSISTPFWFLSAAAPAPPPAAAPAPAAV